MKTYVITLSQVFPTWHKRAGEPTKFRAAFLMKVRKKLAQKVANVKAAEERLKLKIKEYETERKRLDTASR